MEENSFAGLAHEEKEAITPTPKSSPADSKFTKKEDDKVAPEAEDVEEKLSGSKFLLTEQLKQAWNRKDLEKKKTENKGDNRLNYNTGIKISNFLQKSEKPLHWNDLDTAPVKKNGKSFFLTPIFNRIQKQLRHDNERALETVSRQIDIVATGREMCRHPKRFEPLNKSSLSLQDHILKTHAALVFHCDDKIAKKISGLKTGSGVELIKSTQNATGHKCLEIWNEAKGARDIYEEIYAFRDPATGAQGAAYYDTVNDRLTFNFGGTDFTHGKDMRSAAQTIVGVVDMRMTSVKPFIDKTMQKFAERYPGKLPQTPVDIYAHSAGVNSVPLANYFLQRCHNIAPRAQVMMDPFGAKNSFENVAQIAATAEGNDRAELLDTLTRNTISYKVDSGTFIDKLGFIDAYNHTGPGNPAATVGAVEKIAILGNAVTAHMGKSWISFFNTAEINRMQLTASPIGLDKRAIQTDGAKIKL